MFHKLCISSGITCVQAFYILGFYVEFSKVLQNNRESFTNCIEVHVLITSRTSGA